MPVPFWPYLPSTEVCREGSQSDNDITLLHWGSCTGFQSCVISFCQCSMSQGFLSDSIPNPPIFCEELESNIVILFLRFYRDGFLSIQCALCGVRQGFSPTSVSVLLVFLKDFHSCDPSGRVSLHPPKHTPSIAFRHLPPNSARFSYAAEGALFISAQLSMQRRGQRPPKGSGTKYDCRSNLAPKHARKHETHPPRVKKERKKRQFRLDSNAFGFI